MKKIAFRINLCADDWTAERAVIASNVQGLSPFFDKSVHY